MKRTLAMNGAGKALLLLVAPVACFSPSTDGADDAWLLDVAARAVEAGPDVAAVWPGFWPADQPFALWPFRSRVLLVAPNAPGSSSARPVRPGEVPDAIEGLAYVVDDTVTARRSASFVADYRVGDLTVPGVGTLPTFDGPGSGVAADRALLQLQYLYHEAFHGYQDSVFAGRGGRDALEEPFIDPVEVSEPAFRAHGAVERRILAGALAAADPDTVRARARDYLAARGTRLASSAARREAEALVERKEGSARLVGYQAALIAVDGGADRLAPLLREHLLASSLDGDADAVAAYRSQLYATGAAIGALLDRVGVPWRERLEAGASFPELLAVAVDATWPAPEPVPAAVLERYGYERLLSRASEQRWEDPLAAAAAYDGPAIVVVGLRVRSSRYEGRRSAPERGVEVYHEGTTVQLQGDRAVIESEGHVVVGDRRSGRARFTIQLPVLPTVNGAAPSTGRTRYESVRVEGDGITITVEGPVAVEREGDVLTLRVE